MKECFLLANQTQDKRKQCELACQIGNDPSTCKGSSELIFSATNLSMTIMHTPGSPCNNYQVLKKFAFILLYISYSFIGIYS